MGAQEEQSLVRARRQSWLNLNKKVQPAKKQLETRVKATNSEASFRN